MKKERAVFLSICLVLLFSLHPAWISGDWPFAAPSLPQLVFSVASGGHFGPSPNSRIDLKTSHPSSWRSNRALSFLCGDWPSLSLVCDGTQLLGMKLPAVEEIWRKDLYPKMNALKNKIGVSVNSTIRQQGVL